MSEDFQNQNHCLKLKTPSVRHKTNVKLDYDSASTTKWNSETQEIFVMPKIDSQIIGKRRELLMKYFRLCACKDALEEIIGDPSLSESSFLTEYFDNYCNSDFTPLLEISELDMKKIMKNPLYNGNIKTYYKEQFDKGNLKSVTEFRNKNRPFVKRSLFTTPPELAFEEPIDGF